VVAHLVWDSAIAGLNAVLVVVRRDPNISGTILMVGLGVKCQCLVYMERARVAVTLFLMILYKLMALRLTSCLGAMRWLNWQPALSVHSVLQ